MRSFILAIKKVFPLIFWLTVWQGIYLHVNSEILIVSPFDVFLNLKDKIFLIEFWNIVIISIGRILKGFILSIIFGFILAYICHKISFIFFLLKPIFSILKTVPVASFIILALVWIDSDNIPIIMSFIMVMPIIFTELYEGIANVDIKLIEMGKIFSFSKFEMLKNIYFPSIIPYINVALKNGIGLAWKSGIAAEVLSSPKFAIGRKIYDAKIYIDTLELFTWTIVVVILSLFFEKLMSIFLNKFQKYKKTYEV